MAYLAFVSAPQERNAATTKRQPLLVAIRLSTVIISHLERTRCLL